MVESSGLNELADKYGIATEFWDWKGNQTQIGRASIAAALEAMGVKVDTEEDIQAALEEFEVKPWRRMVPYCTVTEEGNPVRFDVHVPSGAIPQVRIKTEDGVWVDAVQVDNYVNDRQIDGQWLGEATFETSPDLPLGYHQIVVDCNENTQTGTLIVTPTKLSLTRLLGQRRVWGLAAQLYSVRSAGSWGVGDFQDLADLCVWSATQMGADYLLINPVHAAQPIPPMDPSPYLPATRRYVNPMYIRPEIIREFNTLPPNLREEVENILVELDRQLADLDKQFETESEDVPHFRIYRDESWSAKMRALRIIYDQGLRPARKMAFEEYCRKEGDSLINFATWCAMYVTFDEKDWHHWPIELQHPGNEAVTKFRQEHFEQVEFFLWLQWIADLQASAAQRTAIDNGMSIGVVSDLAVGVNASGADTWMFSDVYATNVCVGAPPDSYNQLGQDWGQPPWRPDKLQELAYAPFRKMIEAALRHAGGVRIDHILGLFRMWWVPKGLEAKDGVYVRYDHEAMVGVLCLEAYRAQCLVVGEDLGTVEPWVRDYLNRRGILGTSVLWFEYGDGGVPLPPEKWREYCMASVTTHDLPPTTGYLAGDHIRLRHRLGLLTESLDSELAKDSGEQQAWIKYLHQLGLMDETEDDSVKNVVSAMHKFLTLTSARVLNMTLTDAVGDRWIQNQPGTIDEYPNWRVPLCDENGAPLLLEDIFRLNRAIQLGRNLN